MCNFVVINLSDLKLIGKREEKHFKDRVMRVEQNSATRRPKPQQEKRQRAKWWFSDGVSLLDSMGQVHETMCKEEDRVSNN